MIRIIESVLRALQLIFITIAMGLCGALLEQQVYGGTPTRLNYSMFVCALGAVSILYLLPSIFIDAIRHPVIVLALDGLNAIFFLCAGIAMAAELEGRDCSDWTWIQWNGITNGGVVGTHYHQAMRCREANALTAFEWFTAVAFALSFAVVLYDWKKYGDTVRLGRRRPSMRGVY
ncbi:marvel domain-containing protein [Sphaerosporella brunnea]|uniref:Marvel domain-containing protein n=1 Tax=Sphaerosporella brunnea TaxID=1250544 RepID=A0A5J5F959_9PEZI|nr:marvel domain-containing protein [Sphaerosporella brunnea]